MGYIGDRDDGDSCRFRFEMEGKHQLYVLGVNPSVAQGSLADNLSWIHAYIKGISNELVKRSIVTISEKNDYVLDKTIRQVEKFAIRAGYDGFVMLNICAQRTSDPDKLEANDKLHEANKKKLQTYLSGKNYIDVLLAFGDDIDKKGISSTAPDEKILIRYFESIVEILKEHNPTFYVLNDLRKKTCLTVKGNPRHPSRLSDDTELLEINAKSNPFTAFSKWNFLGI